MLQKVLLHNFKALKSTELNFDNSRLCALVGKNSTGKTSVLQSLYYLSSITNTRFVSIFKDESSPEFITTIGEKDISVTVNGFWEDDDNKKNWEISYHWKQENIDSGKKKNTGWNATVSWKANGNEDTWEFKKKSSNISSKMISELLPNEISKSLINTVYLKLVASNLTKAAYSSEIIPKVEFDGSGLAPTLDFLRNEAPDKFKLIEEMLSRIVPNVRKIGIKRAIVPVTHKRLIEVDGKSISYEQSEKMAGQEVILDMNTGERIPAHAISEGTMLTLGLLTVIINPNQPNLVLLDDVEQGLHPKAQRQLMNVFKEIIQNNKNLQIIFSTHSPYIIDELAPAQVHILNNSDSGFTISKRLDEHPDIEWAKQTLTTGEFWGAEGEDWVIAGEVSD